MLQANSYVYWYVHNHFMEVNNIFTVYDSIMLL